MTLYVDEPIYPFRNQEWCHLFSDESVKELNDFAAALKLNPAWFQDRQNFPHYDLSPRMRAAAIKQGAKEVKTEDMVRIVWAWRMKVAQEKKEI